jgi:Tfp pilus assembly protein PilW
VELMIAMLVTMVISGAVFGLMAVGQGSFRREPALTDRQQNIRMAMDIVQRRRFERGGGHGPMGAGVHARRWD